MSIALACGWPGEDTPYSVSIPMIRMTLTRSGYPGGRADGGCQMSGAPTKVGARRCAPWQMVSSTNIARKPTSRAEDVVGEEVEAAAARKAEIDADVDSILDEIDDVLEENAEEFVASFVQKGGQ